MPQVTADSDGRLQLPKGFLNRRGMEPGAQYWLGERNGDVILYPRRRDVRKLYLEPTSRCNLHCRTCIRNVWSDTEGDMDQPTFGRLVASMADLPTLERVVLTGFGEPLAHPNILSMIESLRGLDVAVTVGSNGILLTPVLCRELVRLGVDRLVVSVDGVRPETYESVRGAALAQVLDNLRVLGEVKRELGSLTPALGIEFVALRSNVGELSSLTTLAARIGAARVLVSNVLPYTEGMRQEVLYGHEPRRPFDAAGWPVRADAWVMWGSLELPRMHWGAERRCRFVHDRAMVVGWDGAVSPCYALSHNYEYYAIDGRRKEVTRYELGHLRDSTLADIWTSEDYVRFRSEVRGFHFPSCPDCDLRESCDLRERNEGCWGWNPSCADCLWAQDIVRCP